MLTFKPDTHEYFWDGIKKPGVSDIIDSAGLSDFWKVPKYILDKAAYLGKCVHEACHYLDTNTLDWETLDELLVPYVHAWRQFKEDTRFEIRHSEVKLYSKKYGFAGTPDRIGLIDGKEVLPDIKTGINTIAHGVQTAAYEQLCKENLIIESRRMLRMTVRLNENGTYSIKPHKDRADFAVFKNALEIYKFKNKQR